MSKLNKTFKGQISKETEKAIEITVIEGDELFSTWIPKSALNMKEMPVNCLSVAGVQTFHIHQWFIDLRAKEKPSQENTKTEFLTEAEKPEYETRTLSKDPIKPKSFEEVKTQTVIIPAQPEQRPYFPAMTIFELRDYHLNETNGAIRGHIENIIMRKEAEFRDEEAKIQRQKIIELVGFIEDLMIKNMEGMKK